MEKEEALQALQDKLQDLQKDYEELQDCKCGAPRVTVHIFKPSVTLFKRSVTPFSRSMRFLKISIQRRKEI